MCDRRGTRMPRKKPVRPPLPTLWDEVESAASEPDWSPAAQEDLPECTWSLSVALDPRHRPQSWDRPSSTVRREWCRYPQEAHLVEEDRNRYRRLVADEIAL